MHYQLLRIASTLTCLLFASIAFPDTMRVSDDSNINLNTPGQSNGATVDVLTRNAGSGGVRHGFVRFESR